MCKGLCIGHSMKITDRWNERHWSSLLQCDVVLGTSCYWCCCCQSWQCALTRTMHLNTAPVWTPYDGSAGQCNLQHCSPERLDDHDKKALTQALDSIIPKGPVSMSWQVIIAHLLRHIPQIETWGICCDQSVYVLFSGSRFDFLCYWSCFLPLNTVYCLKSSQQCCKKQPKAIFN